MKASTKQMKWMVPAATVVTMFACGTARSQQFPATGVTQGTLASLSQANSHYGTATSRTYNIPSVNADHLAGIRPVQIRVLAKGLGATDAIQNRISEEEYANRAYEYVRQNLQPVFIYGEQKGALGALLDQAGTAFDQASLLVALLREGGITSASYQLGTISLSDTTTNPDTGQPLNQFYAWTGIADGAAACRLLADGGIPAEINGSSNADCSGTAGPINSIRLRHAWVTATLRKGDGTTVTNVFDPAYKRQIWTAGIDLAAAVGCGSSGSSTCASFLTGYLPAQTTIGGAPALANINTANLEAGFNNYANTLLTNLRGRSPGLDLQGAVGGGRIDLDSFTPAASTLPYAVTDVTSVAEIPDQYRIKMRVQFGLINKQLFADEVAGKRLRILGDVGPDAPGHESAPLRVNLYVEFEMLASNNDQLTTVGPNPLTITVDHPYAASNGTLFDASTVFETHSFLDDTPPDMTAGISFRFGTITIMTAFGPTGQGTSSWFADLQNKNIYKLDVTDKANPAHTWDDCQPYPDGGALLMHVDEGSYFNYNCLGLNQASIGANWLAQNEKLVELIGRVNNTHVLTHHIIGFVKSGIIDPPLMSFDSSYALASRTNSAVDRRAASFTISSMSSRLEGSMTEQTQGSSLGMSGAQVMDMANARGIPLVWATQANFATLRPSLQEYPAWLLDRIRDTYLANGYSVMLPREWELGFYQTPGRAEGTGIEFMFGGFFVFQPSGAKSAYIVAWGLKGTGGVGETDPSDDILASLQQRDASLKSLNFHKVDLQTGALTIAPPPDLVTGIGPFPYSLSFQRTYSSGDTGLPGAVNTRGSRAGRAMRHWESGTTLRYGWKHNLDIRGGIGSNFYRSLGENNAIDATTALATIYLLRDLHGGASTFSTEVVSTYLANWWGKKLLNNEFSVSFGPKKVSYLRLPDDSYVPNSDDGSKVVRTAGDDNTGWYVYPKINYGSLRFELTNADGSKLDFANDGLFTWDGTVYLSILGARTYYPKSWTFPNGVAVSFKYADTNPVSGPPTEYNHMHYCLKEVSNTLGRKITFNFASDYRQQEGYCVVDNVTDENGRTVRFADSEEDGDASTFNPIDHTYTVTLPDGSDIDYHYRSTTDEPGVARAVNVIDGWSFGDGEQFAQVEYDELFRVSSISIAPNNEAGQRSVNTFGIGGLSIGENLRRGELRDALGGVSTSYFNRAGLPILSTDPLGNNTWSTYDALNRLKKVTRPERDSTEYEYDLRNNVTRVIEHPKPGSLFPDRVSSTTYREGPGVRTCTTPACNKPATMTDVRNRVTTIEYNPDGQTRRVRRPALTAGVPETNYCYTSYSGMSLLTGLVDIVSTTPAKPNRVKSFGYNADNKFVLDRITADPVASLDASCAAITKSEARNRTTTLTYDAIGNVRTLDGPRTDVTDVKTFVFDDLRRLREQYQQMGSDPLYAATKYEYNADGTLWTVSRKDESSWRTETRTYWPGGALRSIQDPEGNSVRYVYDLAGRTVAQVDAGQRTAVSTVYDVAGRALCTWKGADPVELPANCSWNPASYAGTGKVRFAAYAYSPNGKMTSVTDGNGNTSQFVFDGFDRPRYTFFPNAANGSRCTLASSSQADIDNGSVSCTSSGGTTPTYERLSYTGSGSPTGALCGANNEVCRKRTRSGQTVTFTYDAAGHVATRTASGIPTATFGYNLLGEMTSATSPAGTVSGTAVPAHSTTYDYDDLGDLRYEENLIGGTARRVSYLHDEAGSRSRTTWDDGYFVTYWYDELSRMTYVRENSTTTNELARYQYDPLSRRKDLRYAGVGTNAQSYTFEPDSSIDVLTSTQSSEVVTFDYGYDAVGRITSVNASDGFYLGVGGLQLGSTIYTPNRLNQYTAVSGLAAPSYDGNGNMTGWGATASRRTFTYDSENRLRRAVVAGGSTTTYDYDANGRRISKRVGSTPTYYQLDGAEEITEYDGSGVILRRYITGPTTDERVATVFGDATNSPPKTYFHFNHQGSVQATTDDTGRATGCAAGLVCQKFAYDAYGNLMPGSSTTGQPFRFTGRRFDEETGLYHYRARYYLPAAGRFLQVDPIGFEDDKNLYAYLKNDPLNFVDPSGMCETTKNGQIINCQVKIKVPNPNSSGPAYIEKEWSTATPAEQQQAKPMYDAVATMGAIAQSNTGSEAAESWKNADEVVFSPTESGTQTQPNGDLKITFAENFFTQMPDGIHSSIIFYQEVTNSTDAEFQQWVAMHEIFHGTKTLGTEGLKALGMPPGPAKDKAKQDVEVKTDEEAIKFLRKNNSHMGFCGMTYMVGCY